MIKVQARMSAKVDDRESFWFLDNDCPLPMAKEMLSQFQRELFKIEDQIKSQMEAAKAIEDAKQAAEQPKPDIAPVAVEQPAAQG